MPICIQYTRGPPPLYYYLSNSSRAATVLCGAGWQPAADCGCPLGAARRAELACARDDPAPGSPEYLARLGCGSAAMRGRLATCGPAQRAPAIGPASEARAPAADQPAPRAPGISPGLVAAVLLCGPGRQSAHNRRGMPAAMGPCPTKAPPHARRRSPRRGPALRPQAGRKKDRGPRRALSRLSDWKPPQTFKTFSACRPLGPCLTSNSTSEPSSRLR